MTRPRIYFINLSHRKDRRESIEGQLNALGFDATRVEAATPEDTSPADIARYCRPANPFGLSPKEMACVASHLRAWRQFLADGGSHALILEDDAVLSRRLPAFLDGFGKRPLDGIVRLVDTRGPVRLSASLGEWSEGIELHNLLGRAISAAGYILDREAAALLLTRVDRLLRQPIDLSIFDPFNRIRWGIALRQAAPALVTCLDVTALAGEAAARRDIDDRMEIWYKTRRQRAHDIWVVVRGEFISQPVEFVQHLMGTRKHDVLYAPE
jgi:glycosyl transferase family 25